MARGKRVSGARSHRSRGKNKTLGNYKDKSTTGKGSGAPKPGGAKAPAPGGITTSPPGGTRSGNNSDGLKGGGKK